MGSGLGCILIAIVLHVWLKRIHAALTKSQQEA